MAPCCAHLRHIGVHDVIALLWHQGDLVGCGKRMKAKRQDTERHGLDHRGQFFEKRAHRPFDVPHRSERRARIGDNATGCEGELFITP